MISEKTWEPPYIRLSPEQTRAKITALCQFCNTYRTSPNPEAARRLGLGPSAYEYRNLDEAALVAFEAELMAPWVTPRDEPPEPTPEDAYSSDGGQLPTCITE